MFGTVTQKDRRIFTPDVTPDFSEKMLKKWSRAVEMCLGWLDVGEVGGELEEQNYAVLAHVIFFRYPSDTVCDEQCVI